MPPRKKNLHKRETIKVPYAVLYTHRTAEEKPVEPGERQQNIRELELQARRPRRRPARVLSKVAARSKRTPAKKK